MGSGSSLTSTREAFFRGATAKRGAFAIGLGVLLCFTSAAHAGRTIYVNGATGSDTWTGLCRTHLSGTCGPKKTIKAGISASVSGDTVLVADGTYSGTGNQEINFGGRLITVRSENGPAACVLDGGGAAVRIFVFNAAETADTVLDGFTITHTELC